METSTSNSDKSASRALEKLKHVGIDNILDVSVQPRQVPKGRGKANKIRINEPDAPILPLEEYPEAFLILLGKLMRHAPSLEEARTVLLEHVERRRNNASLSDRVCFAREALIQDVEKAVEELKVTSGKAKGKRRADSPLEETRQAPARKKVRFSLTGEDGEQLVLPSDPLGNADPSECAVKGGRPSAHRRKCAAISTELLIDCLKALGPGPQEQTNADQEKDTDELLVTNISSAIMEVQHATKNLAEISRCDDLLAALSNVDKLETKGVEVFAAWEERHVANRAQSICKVLERDNGLVLADDLKARFKDRII